MSPIEFAKLGIQGLRSALTVREHRHNWRQAIADGQAIEVGPDDVVTLPDEDYPYPPSRIKSTLLYS